MLLCHSNVVFISQGAGVVPGGLPPHPTPSWPPASLDNGVVDVHSASMPCNVQPAGSAVGSIIEPCIAPNPFPRHGVMLVVRRRRHACSQAPARASGCRNRLLCMLPLFHVS